MKGLRQKAIMDQTLDITKATQENHTKIIHRIKTNIEEKRASGRNGEGNMRSLNLLLCLILIITKCYNRDKPLKSNWKLQRRDEYGL